MFFIISLVLIIPIIFISYIAIKYTDSRNKKLFFKGNEYKTYLWTSLLLVGGGGVILFLLPLEPIDISWVEMHSENSASDYAEGSLLKEYFLEFTSIFTEMNLIGLLFAALILIVWLFYIRGLDFFNKEKISTTILAFLLGAVLTFLVFPLSDLLHYTFNIEYSESYLYNLFVYSTFGIGIVEELVKLIPVLIIWKLTDEIDEPIDLIYYVSISALGFAFVENLIYFREISGGILIARALISAAGHMIFASFSVYGFILYRFHQTKKSPINILYYFALGAFIHGLFDFLLLESQIFLFIVFFTFSIQAWAIIINNAINNSTFFDYQLSFRHDPIKFNLALNLAGLIVFSFVINGILLGRSDAFYEYLVSLAWGGMLIIFYISSISSFDLIQGYWRPVLFQFRRPNDDALPFVRGLSIFSTLWTENTITPINYVGEKIKLHSPKYNHNLCEIFHIGEGIIENRIMLEKEDGNFDRDWFLVKISPSLDILDDYEKDMILIKLRSKYSSLVHDEHIECSLKIIHKGVDPMKSTNLSSYLSYGFIEINGDDYVYEDQNLITS